MNWFEIKLNNKFCVKLVENCVENMFGSVVVVAFQIIFHAEMHVNDIFLFLKIIFDISILKRSKTYKTY